MLKTKLVVIPLRLWRTARTRVHASLACTRACTHLPLLVDGLACVFYPPDERCRGPAHTRPRVAAPEGTYGARPVFLDGAARKQALP